MGTQPYVITDYSKQQAKKLGVDLRQSSNPKKKIDVYKAIPLPFSRRLSSVAVGDTQKRYEKIASIGATGYGDFPTWTKLKGKTYADEKRRLYRLRHKGEEKVIGSNGYYAWYILW